MIYLRNFLAMLEIENNRQLAPSFSGLGNYLIFHITELTNMLNNLPNIILLKTKTNSKKTFLNKDDKVNKNKLSHFKLKTLLKITLLVNIENKT